MGSHGIVRLNQNSLKFLSLTTDSSCHQGYNKTFEINLANFRQLTYLRWRAPSAESIVGPLSDAIRLNSGRLRELEVDFIDWPSIYDYINTNSGEISEENYFMREVLQLKEAPSHPCFGYILTLSLSNVPIGAAMAQTVNYNTLISLTLRSCPEWEKFLRCVLDLRILVRLRTLEIQFRGVPSDDEVISDFLVAFQGLVNFSVSSPYPPFLFDFLDLVAHHRASLKRFIMHERDTPVHQNNSSPNSGEEYDHPDLSVSRGDLCRLDEPLASLDLDFIGLCSLLDRLVVFAASLIQYDLTNQRIESLIIAFQI